MAFFADFKRSAAELKDLRCLTVTAVLIALDLVLKTFVNVQISDDLKLNFAFIAVAAIGMLYGPTTAGLACIVTDILGYLLKPTGTFSPMFTVIEMTGGVLYGVFLYRMRTVRLDFSDGGKNIGRSLAENWRGVVSIVMAKVSVALVCNLIMTPLAITVNKTLEAGAYVPEVFWVGFWTRVSTRLIKNAIEVPVHVVILILALFPIKAAYDAVFRKQKKAV